METPEQYTEKLLKMKDDLPRQAPIFSKGDIVDTRFGKMKIVDPEYGHSLIDNIWVPRIDAGFMTKYGFINKTKKHKQFNQCDVTKIEES
jgi:hypothetical protein